MKILALERELPSFACRVEETATDGSTRRLWNIKPAEAGYTLAAL